ncbi:MAG: MoxR family ATPase [Bacteroidia bacterium]
MDNLNEAENKENSQSPIDDGQRFDSAPDYKEIDTYFVQQTFDKIRSEVKKLIIGNEKLLELTLVGLLSGGHILFEGVPGVAKTLISKLLAKSIGVNFQRIQFTPDLMPSDLLGTSIFNMKESDFQFKKGPIFSNLILIDEINRAPAKTQAALLEVMEERQVTIDGVTYPMSLPFFVIATQNPIESEGTYRLPDAQLDRFLFKLKVGHPSLEEEKSILNKFKSTFNVSASEEEVNEVVQPEDIAKCQSIIEQVHIKDELIDYIAKIVHETRNHGEIYLGASPRASLSILKTAKGVAAMRGRSFVTPDDIQNVCIAVLNHRIILTPEKEMAGGTKKEVIKSILKEIEVPR